MFFAHFIISIHHFNVFINIYFNNIVLSGVGIKKQAMICSLSNSYAILLSLVSCLGLISSKLLISLSLKPFSISLLIMFCVLSLRPSSRPCSRPSSRPCSIPCLTPLATPISSQRSRPIFLPSSIPIACPSE